ncbi:MAG: DUF975 family protein, partial [Candidatus Coproplasma sp.]
VALVLIEGPFALSWAIISLKVLYRREVDLGDMFIGFKNFGKSVALKVINDVFILLWSLLLIVPGVIKAYSYAMSFYILTDNPQMGPRDARLRSVEMMKGNKWRLFCLDCSFIGWGLLCILTFGVLSMWVIPYKQCAYAAFYEELKREQGGVISENIEQPSDQPVEEPFADLSAQPSTEDTAAKDENTQLIKSDDD